MRCCRRACAMRAATTASKPSAGARATSSPKRRITSGSSSSLTSLTSCSFVVVQGLAQAGTAACDVGLHRAERQARGCADLTVAHMLAVGENDAQAHARGQKRQCALEVELLPHGRHYPFFAGYGLLVERQLPSHPAGVLQPFIDGEPPQPATEGAGSLQSAQPAPGLQEGLLREII